ncbi:DUF2141 domain-containing protein [Echinicola marina]|uniref:DUF2141 domain-containing protein n=1 Tax=Echinicola marina TaxID=2859768 RepID=UPI001CF61EC6|nr:DUF2141 domain-containing protein [Echinicola marina]UCS95484.1 DUF2141 domain-containing protein [Echinicola marina]
MKLLVLILALLYPAERFNTTVLSIDNLEFSLGGQVKIQVYEQGFVNDIERKSVWETTVKVSESCLPITLEKLPAGSYMIAVFHDSNANGKMDYTFFGRPKEGYSFSGRFNCDAKSAGPKLHYINLKEGFQHVNLHLCY